MGAGGEHEKKIKKVEVEEEVITAIYKLNLHCPQCARAIQRPLLRTEGVQKVEIDSEKGKISVKGKIDPKKIHGIIERRSKRKVELISPLPRKVETKVVEKKVEKKEAVVKTTVLKVDIHCEKCEYDLKKKLLQLEGVHIVKMNREKQTCTVEGTMEAQKLIKYLRKKLRKHAEIVPQKEEEKKEKEKEKKKEVETKIVEIVKEKREETTKTTEYIVPYPYVIHHYGAYAPHDHLFSDENPNACTIM